MRISFSPQQREDRLQVFKNGDVLIVAGKTLDFSPMPDESWMPASAVDSPWFTGIVERRGGELAVTLILPHGPYPAKNVAFPSTLENVPDGLVELPTGEATVAAGPTIKSKKET